MIRVFQSVELRLPLRHRADPPAIGQTQLARRYLNPPKPNARQPDRDLLRLEETLSGILGALVVIRADKKGAGKISIAFANLDQLEDLLERFREA